MGAQKPTTTIKVASGECMTDLPMPSLVVVVVRTVKDPHCATTKAKVASGRGSLAPPNATLVVVVVFKAPKIRRAPEKAGQIPFFSSFGGIVFGNFRAVFGLPRGRGEART